MLLVRHIAVVAGSTALLLGAACSNDDDPMGPTVAQVAGTYQATKFTATSALGSEDVLQSGGSLTATFAANGTVTGHVKIPSQAVDEDFAGQWKIDNGEVELEQVPTDIFVEDLTFSVVGNTLVADETFSAVRVQVTMTKQ